MNEDMMLLPGTMLHGGSYRVERQISHGGFGNTYEVRNMAFGERQAMKEFFMRTVTSRRGNEVTVSISENQRTFDEQRKKFRSEAQTLRGLNNPHLVRVHDLFEENGTVYYIMDYIDGESLADTMKRVRSPMGELEARALLAQMLDALECVHSENIWHLDIKPANIMVDRQGTAFLIDFGASKQMTPESRSTVSAQCYTPRYAPIEQREQVATEYGPWTDFYALGATLYNMLTCLDPPTSTEMDRQGERAFKFPSTVSKQMQAVVIWMMAPQRTQRPQTIEQIRQMLYVPTPGTETVIPQTPRPQQRKKHWGTAIAVGIVAMLVAALVALAWFVVPKMLGKDNGRRVGSQTEQQEDANERQTQEYTGMEGYIMLPDAQGRDSVRKDIGMDLVISRTRVTGRYYYKRLNPDGRGKEVLTLRGVNDGGRLQLSETAVDKDGKEVVSGYFTGKLRRGKFEGVFTLGKNRKEMRFMVKMP